MAVSLLVLLELKEQTATSGTYCRVARELVKAHDYLPGSLAGCRGLHLWEGKLQTAGALEKEDW